MLLVVGSECVSSVGRVCAGIDTGQGGQNRAGRGVKLWQGHWAGACGEEEVQE